MNNKYAKALENALYNWYNSGENAATEPLFNVLSAAYENNMQFLVPIELPDALLEQLAKANVSDLQDGSKFSIDEEMPINFCHIPVDGEGHYIIPIFTSEEQLNMGGDNASINQPFKAFMNSLDQWEDCVGFVINPYSNKILINQSIRDKIVNYKPKSHVAIVKKSVLDMHVDAMVNSAHKTLLGGKIVDEILLADGEEIDEAFLCGGGLNGAVHEAAGMGLFNECKTLGGCNVGEAKITGAYDHANAEHIIHTVGPLYTGEEFDEENKELLEKCYNNALDLALENGCESIAFPCISTGANRYPVGKTAPIAIITVVQWFEAHPDAVLNVYLCCFTEYEYKNYKRMIKM